MRDAIRVGLNNQIFRDVCVKRLEKKRKKGRRGLPKFRSIAICLVVSSEEYKLTMLSSSVYGTKLIGLRTTLSASNFDARIT